MRGSCSVVVLYSLEESDKPSSLLEEVEESLLLSEEEVVTIVSSVSFIIAA